ncbi:AAA family ATPase [Salaquimonas pukyongi]|uniref:AAA family ATPase n=1 Tax=Salaquimonas pukyongi TaxID=2712698 RepID=UPI00096BA393|nr:CpaE family protein [Salaquimonas pukyongi]
MSNQLQEDLTMQEAAVGSESPAAGDLNKIQLVPRITVQAFCETEIVSQTIDMAARDRRMSRATVKVLNGGLASAVEYFQSAPTPNLIIIETRLDGVELMTGLSRLAEVCDMDTKVIVVGHRNDISVYRELIANGVSDYLVAPLSMADLMSAISDIFVDPEAGPLGKVLAFLGAKGGVGSSTICHNVAWTISSRYSSEVILTDLDLAFGTANINLDQDPPQGIAEAVYSPDRMDDILLDRLLAKCADHLNLLAAPSTLDRTYDFTQDAFNGVLEVAQRSSPMVVLDLPHQWSAWTKHILSIADEVVITASPELANLRNTKNLLDKLGELRPNDTLPKLVMNQVGVPKRPEISVADFIRPLDVQPAAVIPFEPALFGMASNNGQMISEADPKSAIVGSIEYLTQLVTGKAEMKVEKKGSLGILSKLKLGKNK